MKKNFFRLLACVMAFAMVLSLAACGGDSKSSSASSSASSAASSEASGSEASSEASSSEASSSAATNTGKYASVSEFLADPTVSAQLESVMASLDDSMNIDISGEGDSLIYTFTFTEALEDVETVKATMEEMMTEESFASTFRGIAASLADAIEVENPSVIVTYLDTDGSEVCSQEYFPE